MGSVRKEVYEVGSGRSSGVLRACMGRMRLVMTPEAAHGNRLCLQKKQFASSSIRMTSVKTGRERSDGDILEWHISLVKKATFRSQDDWVVSGLQPHAFE